MKSTLMVVAILLASLLPGSRATAAQGVGASGDLTGTVTDPTGAGVPNAKITVTDPGQGVERGAMTDEHGGYPGVRFSPQIDRPLVPSGSEF